MQMNLKNLAEGDIGEHIKRMAMPAAIGLFFQAMYNVTDAYYVGQLSIAALAAISLSFPIYFLILSIGSGLSIATTALTAKARGAQHEHEAKHLAAQALVFGILLSVLAGVLGLVTADYLFSLIGAKGEVHKLVIEYMGMIYYGMPFFFLVMVLNGILNAVGDTKTFGKAIAFGFLLNIILDPWFMYGWFGLPAMGVAGVALATVVTQIINTLWLFRQVMRYDILPKEIKDYLLVVGTWRKLAGQSIPTTLTHASVSLGFLVIIIFVSSFGELAIATYGIGTRIDQLIILPAIGIAGATVALTGQNLGAKKIERINETFKKAIIYSMQFLVAGIAAVLIFAPQLAGIFTKDAKLIEMTTTYLRITSLAYIGVAILIISGSVLQGLAKAKHALMLTFLRMVVISIPAVLLFAYFLGLRELGIWLGVLASTLIMAGISYWYVNRMIGKLQLSKN